MICSRKQLCAQVVRTPDERLALELADHPTCQVFRNLPQTILYLRQPLLPLAEVESIVPAQEPLRFLHLHPRLRQLRDLALQHRHRHHRRLHVLREAGVEDRLPDEVVVRPPAAAG